MKKIFVICVLIVLPSCTHPLQQPAERVADTLLPEYIKYVESDPRFENQPASAKRRVDAAKSFIEAVNSGRSR